VSAGCSTPADDATLIEQFATDLTQSAACHSGGYHACQKERLARAYPGALDEQAALACIAASDDDVKYRYAVTVIPGSISPDPEWVGPSDPTSPDWRFAGQRPQGNTYRVALAVSDEYMGDPHDVTWDAHLTVRDGKVYWYPKIC
jgi:hypothetical protein